MELNYNGKIRAMEQREEKLTNTVNLILKVKTIVMSVFEKHEKIHKQKLLEYRAYKNEEEAKLRISKIQSENYVKGVINSLDNINIQKEEGNSPPLLLYSCQVLF